MDVSTDLILFDRLGREAARFRAGPGRSPFEAKRLPAEAADGLRHLFDVASGAAADGTVAVESVPRSGCRTDRSLTSRTAMDAFNLVAGLASIASLGWAVWERLNVAEADRQRLAAFDTVRLAATAGRVSELIKTMRRLRSPNVRRGDVERLGDLVAGLLASDVLPDHHRSWLIPLRNMLADLERSRKIADTPNDSQWKSSLRAFRIQTDDLVRDLHAAPGPPRELRGED